MEKEKQTMPEIEIRFAIKNEKEGDFTYQIKEITDEELAAIGPNATREALARYNCTAVSWYRRVHDGKTTTVHSSEEHPIFVMECGDLKLVYQPLNPNKVCRISYYGKKDHQRLINGTEQLREAYAEHDKGRAPEPKVMICAYMRDALNMAGLGYHTLWTPANHAYFDMKVLGRMIEGRASIELSDEFKKLFK